MENKVMENTKTCECAEMCLPESICIQIDQYRLHDEHPESQLIAVLHAVQMHFGYLPEVILDEVAQRLQVPTSTVSGVASFYHFFNLTPPGRHSISVCLGTACFVKGADKILEAFQSELGISLGETSSDGEFSLNISRCLGICALAPVVQIDDQVYSQVKPHQVPQILSKIREKEED
ncbi:MAG: NADH-quinone oxidoreductase subunit NuoE [Saccharofermentanales bacterium]